MPETQSQVTVTGYAGPGITVTAQVITDVVSFGIECQNEILVITQNNGHVTRIAIEAATTITVTVSGNNYTVSVS
jgi:hypothetical protein